MSIGRQAPAAAAKSRGSLWIELQSNNDCNMRISCVVQILICLRDYGYEEPPSGREGDRWRWKEPAKIPHLDCKKS